MTGSPLSLEVRLPVAFVDTLLPQLRDTELRVFLIVLRQVQVRGKERASAWLTHGELCRRTGRASEAVSTAIEALCQRGLLQVREEGGPLLSSAVARQRAIGRRFYSLSPLALSAEAAVGKAKTIEAEKGISYSLRFSEGVTPDQRARIAEEKQRIRETLTGLSRRHPTAER